MKNRDGETAVGGCAADVVTTGRLPEFAVGAWDDTVLVDGGVSSGVVSASGAKPGDSDVGRVLEAARTKLNNWYREISQCFEIRKIVSGYLEEKCMINLVESECYLEEREEQELQERETG